MRKRISGLSVSQKTLVLLILWIMLPLTVIGWFITGWINRGDIQAEQDITMQRLYSISENIAGHMETVRKVANTLAMDESISDIARKREGSTQHYAANQLMKASLEYNEFIIKTQILSEVGKVTWQYGIRQGYIFPEYGNENYAELVSRREKTSFWSAAHPLLQLQKGKYEQEVWVASFYSGIYEAKSMRMDGVLALHVREDFLCNIYKDFLYGEPVAAWLVSGEGQLLSATEKSWLPKEIPKELRLGKKPSKTGIKRVSFNRDKMEMFWQKCGDEDCYLVQLSMQRSLLGSFGVFVIAAMVLFAIIYAGYMYFYRIYVIHPLESLTRQMERAKNLELQQEALPAKGDEIGLLATTFQSMLSRIDELIAKVYVEKIKTQEAEQEAMLSQINPHFLYNTLDSIRWNALSHGDKEVGRQLEALSVMLRNSLNFGETETTIKHEIQTIENYCYLLQARFRKEIEVDIQVDELVAEQNIPKLLMQPLVENAYRHGLENKIGLKRIWIRVRKVKDKIVICVADNGVGCDKALILEQMETQEAKVCFALKNIRDRISLCYGQAGSFHFSSRPGRGTVVKIILPFETDFTRTGEK